MERAEFETKVKEIGSILGYKVEVEDGKGDLAKLTKGKELIHLSNDGYQNPDRIVIRGFYPNGQSNYAPSGRYSAYITVAEKKTAEQIAKDIERRLLPGYKKQLEQVITENAEAVAYIEKQRDNLVKIAKAAGVTVQWYDEKRAEGVVYASWSSWRFKPAGSNLINIEIRGMDADRVCRLIEHLKETG